MRAAAGAIEKVVFDGQSLHCSTIGGAAPRPSAAAGSSTRRPNS